MSASSPPTGAMPAEPAMKTLHESEERFRLLVDSVKDYAIFILDPEGRVSTWNAGAARIKGYAADEIIGKHFSAFYPREDIAAGKCEHELRVAASDGRFEDEGWRLRKDGTRLWASVVITALRDEHGTLVGFAKVTRDLTDRVRAEQARTQALVIQESARRKDEFLAIMGHELRNPLAAIVTAAHLIRLRGGRASEREMDVLERQARQMTRLVDDLLDASRALRDQVTLLPKVTEIGHVLASAIDLASPVIEQRRHVMTFDVRRHGLPVNVDAERMAQVFGNILSNAAKYTPEGGRIDVSTAAHERHVLVSIEDSGQGLPPDMLERIFDLFVQGEQGFERREGGLGIGLAVARKLVEAHHGEIFAESAGPGRGSRFTVRLPVADTAQAAQDLTAPTAARGARRRILLVDDNHDSIEMMRTVLDHLGHETHVAFDGPSAVDAFRAFQPDIVFLDIGLPGLSGYEVAARLRLLPGGQALPIIAISGYASDVDRARAAEAGFTSHVAKPVEIKKLEELVAGAGN